MTAKKGTPAILIVSSFLWFSYWRAWWCPTYRPKHVADIKGQPTELKWTCVLLDWIRVVCLELLCVTVFIQFWNRHIRIRVLKFFYVILILLVWPAKELICFPLIATVPTRNPAWTDLGSNPAPDVGVRRLNVCEKAWKCHDFDRAALHAWLAFDIGVLRTAPASRHHSCISIIIEI